VVPSQRCGHAPEGCGAADLFRGHPAAGDEVGDEDPIRFQEVCDLWSHAALACRERARVLPAAINSQELAVFPRHPDDERLPVYVYPVVEVGDPSTQRRDRDGGAGPPWNPTDDFV